MFNVSYLGPYELLLFTLLSGAQRSSNVLALPGALIVMGFSDTSTLVGHFVSSPRAREKSDRRYSSGIKREGQERKRNRNETKKQKKQKHSPVYR